MKKSDLHTYRNLPAYLLIVLAEKLHTKKSVKKWVNKFWDFKRGKEKSSDNFSYLLVRRKRLVNQRTFTPVTTIEEVKQTILGK